MSSYYTPKNVVIGRHWKRPKPRVYECNVRDAERFYQETYKDYLQSKDFAARRASEDRTTRIEDEPASRWSVRRTNSIVDSPLDSSIRDTLRNGSVTSSYYDSGSSRGRGDESYSSSIRSSSVLNQRRESPEGDIATIEQRLSRLRKLREELGLPSEAGGGISFSPSAATSSLSSVPSDSRERKNRMVESTSTYSSARGGSKSRDVDSYADKYSSGATERSSKYSSKYSNGGDSCASDMGTTSRYSSKYGNDDGGSSVTKYASKYKDDDSSSYSRASDSGTRQNGRSVTFNTAAKDDSDSYGSYKGSSRTSGRKYDQEDDSSYGLGSSGKSYKSSVTESNSYKNAGKSAIDNDVGDYDDDELLSSIKKKFPTSDEIMKRIKKLDDDL